MSQHHTLVDKLQQWAQEQGESPAFIFRSPNHGRYELSWTKLYRLGGRFAADLKSRGLGRGQLVVNTLVNSPERVVCEAGIWMSGAASVNGHCQMADGSDLVHTIRVSRASALLVDPDVSNSPWKVLKSYVSLGENDDVTSSDLPNLKKLFFVRRVEGGDREDFITRLETQDEWFQADDIMSADILTVFTTSGSTGFSKLVAYAHCYYLSLFGSQRTSATDICRFKTAPLGWLGGFVGHEVANCDKGVIWDARAGGISNNMPEIILESIAEEQCNEAFINPMHLSGLERLIEKRHENSDSKSDTKGMPDYKLNKIILGGLPITKKMMQCALSMAEKVMIGYGATDFPLVSLLTVTDSETFVDYDTGPPVEGVSVRIVGHDDEDTALPVNQVGNILIKSPRRHPGYLNDPSLRPEEFITKDGFFRTQDVGRLDERGHLLVEGRGSDAIMRGPYIFYPSWIEERIRACPGVHDVIVTGIPDPFLNEELCACVMLDSDSVTLDQVRHFVEKDVVTPQDDPLSPRPRYYLQFESFPETDSGKPKRKMIKAQAEDKIRCGEGLRCLQQNLQAAS